MSETSGSCFERSGKTEKTMSCLGSKLAIILLERGMPSRCASSKRIDYVPAICTHRPSLLPMPVGYRSTDFLPFGVWGEVDPCLTSRGSKSRNKVAVGEPAAGSFRELSNINRLESPFMSNCVVFNCTHCKRYSFNENATALHNS